MLGLLLSAWSAPDPASAANNTHHNTRTLVDFGFIVSSPSVCRPTADRVKARAAYNGSVHGMRAVSASMVRQSGGTSQVIQPDVVEHCEPASTSARVE